MFSLFPAVWSLFFAISCTGKTAINDQDTVFSETDPENTDTGLLSSEDSAEPGEEHIPKVMFAVHIDPNSPSSGVVHATAQNWLRLKNFVATADTHGHKLTLLFHSDWMPIIEGSPNGIETITSWVNHGHQIGYHHHTCGHPHPDGYRDVELGNCGGEPDRGSVQDSFSELQALSQALVLNGVEPSLAGIDIAAQGPNDFNQYRAKEWQPEAIYATGTIGDNSDEHGDHQFITKPRCTENYGNEYGVPITFLVPEMGHAQLDVGNFTEIQVANNIDALESEIEQVLQGDHAGLPVHLGLVIHPDEYDDNMRATDRDNYPSDKAYLDAILQLLADKGIQVRTAREILSSTQPCLD